MRGRHGWSLWRETLVCRAIERFARVRKTQTPALVLAISWTHRIGGQIEYGIRLTDRCSFIYTPRGGHTYTVNWIYKQTAVKQRHAHSPKHSIKHTHIQTYTSAHPGILHSLWRHNMHPPVHKEAYTHIHAAIISHLLIGNFQPVAEFPCYTVQLLDVYTAKQ